MKGFHSKPAIGLALGLADPMQPFAPARRRSDAPLQEPVGPNSPRLGHSFAKCPRFARIDHAPQHGVTLDVSSVQRPQIGAARTHVFGAVAAVSRQPSANNGTTQEANTHETGRWAGLHWQRQKIDHHHIPQADLFNRSTPCDQTCTELAMAPVEATASANRYKKSGPKAAFFHHLRSSAWRFARHRAR
jgi:hypothetical protein